MYKILFRQTGKCADEVYGGVPRVYSSVREAERAISRWLFPDMKHYEIVPIEDVKGEQQ